MSTGLGLVTILGCLNEGEKLANLDPANWRTGTTCPATYFVEKFVRYPKEDVLKKFSKDSLRSFATNNHPEVIAKMKEWKMRLDEIPQGGSTAIYMISQLREMMKWLCSGRKVMHGQWPEFILDQGVRFFGVRGGHDGEMVVEVDIQGGDKMYFCRCDREMKDELDLLQYVLEGVEAEMHNIVSQVPYTGVQIPCILADLEPDLGWLLGTENAGYTISYAQQKILFGMNEIGFAVREETAIAMEKCIRLEYPPYVLSPKGESFLCWRRRPGVLAPVSLFQFTKDDFKDPGELSKIVE